MSWGTGVAPSATANTYGTVTELIAAGSNVMDSWGIEIIIGNTGASAVASAASLDILVGGATDDVLIKSLLCGYTYNQSVAHYLFPIHIPAGLRIAAQASTERTSGTTFRVMVFLYQGGVPPWRVGRKVTTYGTKASNSRGVAITPAASGGAATETQIVASTTENHFAFDLALQAATDTTITPAGQICTQLGVGAVTADKVGAQRWFGKSTEEYWQTMGARLPIFADVPSGTRLSIWSSNSGANDAAHDAHVYGIS
jgi:hypothetical protein